MTAQPDAAAGFIASKLPAESLAALKGGSEDAIRESLAKGFDVLLDGGPLWDDSAFKAVEFSSTTVALQKQVDALQEKDRERLAKRSRIGWRTTGFSCAGNTPECGSTAVCSTRCSPG